MWWQQGASDDPRKPTIDALEPLLVCCSIAVPLECFGAVVATTYQRLPEVGNMGGSAHGGEEMPLAGYAFERVRAAVFEFEP